MPDVGQETQPVPDGVRRLQVLQEAGFGSQDMLAYKQQRTQALLHGGYSPDEVNTYWGDHPVQGGNPTGDKGLLSAITSHAWENFATPIVSAKGQEDADWNDIWSHAFHPSQLEQESPPVAQAGMALRGAKVLWDGLGEVFSPLVGAVNTVAQPATSRVVAANNIPAPHVTFDLRRPDSNILDPTQWVVTPTLLHGPEAQQEYSQIATGLGSIGVGALVPHGAPQIRAAPAARAAALQAFRAGEISDPGGFAASTVRGRVSPRIQAQFPALDAYGQAARTLAPRGGPEVLNRLTHNMMEVWSRTGLTPGEQAQMASRSTALRFQLVSQDVAGQPVAPGFQVQRSAADVVPPRTPETPFGMRQDPRDLDSLSQRPPAFPTQVGGMDQAMQLFRRLEGSGDAAVSPAGAIGRYQIMPQTARAFGFDPARLADPNYNTQAAQRILGSLMQQYGGNMDAVAIAYNAGPRHASEYLAGGPGTRLEAMPDSTYRGGVRYVRVRSARDESILPSETQRYLANMRRYTAGATAEGGHDFAYTSPTRVPMDAAGRQRLNQLRANPEGYLTGILGRPVTITSEMRSAGSQARLQAEGRTNAGANQTEHSAANFAAGYGAWDIKVPGMTNQEVIARLERAGLPYDQLIEEGDHVHMGFGPRSRGQVFALRGGHLGPGEAAAGADTAYPGRWEPSQAAESLLPTEPSPGEEMVRQSGSIGAASVWDDATPDMVTSEIQSQMGTQPDHEVFPNYNALDHVYSETVSALHPFEALDKLLPNEQAAENLDPEGGASPTIRQAFQQVNGADSRASAAVRDGIVDFNGGQRRIVPDSPSLIDAINQARKDGKYGEWVVSMLAKRTVNRATQFLDRARIGLTEAMDAESSLGPKATERQRTNARNKSAQAHAAFEEALKNPGIDTGINPFAARRVTTDPYWQRYNQATDLFQQVNRGVNQYGADSGRFSQGMIDSLAESDPIYIAMQRTGLDSRGTGFRRLAGSERNITSDPIAASVSNWRWIFRESDRNAATTQLVAHMQANPDIAAKFGIRQIDTPSIAGTDIDKALSDFGFPAEDMDRARDAFSALIQAKLDERLAPNQFSHYVGGQRQVWSTGDELLAKAIRGVQSPMEATALMKGLNLAADIERAGIMAGPDWGWVFGSIHQLSQFINDPLHPIPGFTVLRGWTRMMTGSDIVGEARANGAMNASMADVNDQYLQNLAADIDRDHTMGLGERLQKGVRDIWSDESSAPSRPNTFLWPVQLSRMITEAIDEGNRVGLYEQGRKSGMSPAAAGSRARATGLDFQDRGLSQVARLLTRATPMYAGFLKGTEQWGSALAKRPLSTVAFAGSTYGAAVFINTALNIMQDRAKKADDPTRFDQIPDYDKDRYLITPEINGARLHLRLPPGPVGFLFGGMQQRLMSWAATHNPKAFEGGVSDFFAENFRLPFPALVAPPIEAVTNHNFYSGHAIVPDSLKGLAPQEQVAPYTTNLSRSVAGVLDPLLTSIGARGASFSPMQMDHLIQGWTGTAGLSVVSTIGGNVQPGPPTDITRVPGISRLFEQNPGVNAQSISDFYTDKEQFDSAFTERQMARRNARGDVIAGQPTPQPGQVGAHDIFYQDAIEDAAYARADTRLNQISGMLGRQRDAVWAVYASQLPDEEKRTHINDLVSNMVRESQTASYEMSQFRQQHPVRH